jgi:hypothetical protein
MMRRAADIRYLPPGPSSRTLDELMNAEVTY